MAILYKRSCEEKFGATKARKSSRSDEAILHENSARYLVKVASPQVFVVLGTTEGEKGAI